MKGYRKLISHLLMTFISGLSIQAAFAGTQTAPLFEMVSGKQTSSILIDPADAQVVSIAANILASDIDSITGQKPETVSQINQASDRTVIAGTIGQSQWIDNLVSQGKLDISQIKGQWERYSIQLMDNPFPGIKQALIIVGSDRRATAYGLLELSRKAGVSPWEWWADVTPKKQTRLNFQIQNQIYGSPSVKYRGVFLNDEDWGLQRWAALTYEPETGDIGPKTYAKIFELLLRLRANTIWPAMHKSTQAFYYYPDNKKVADDYAIVIGTSHAEPMLSNINVEWDHSTMGDYRYDTNSNSIKAFFTNRAEETAQYENIYTVGMRGEHDSPMIVGEDDTDSQVKLLEQVITDQRAILNQATAKPATQLAQAFVPYKEVLKYYQSGLELPDDISLVWTDDNYGYIRQLSSPQEQKRAGGAGVYYHTSYWGRPHDYLWLNSTSPALMWQQMHKAYQHNARNIWILNVGDIKPHEYNMELFLDMAWDIDKLDHHQAIQEHQFNWAQREFGTRFAHQVNQMMNDYYQLAYQRRPEFMAWSQVEPVTKSGETQLSQFQYGDEVMRRLTAYEKLEAQVDALYSQIEPSRQDAFFQLVYYPIISAANINKQWLYHYKNQFVAQQSRISAPYYGRLAQQAHQRIQSVTRQYNLQVANGKWSHIMTASPRNLPVFKAPVTAMPSPVEGQLGVALEGYEMQTNRELINSFADVLPVFNAYTKTPHYFDVYLKNKGKLAWKAKANADWVQLSQTQGRLNENAKPEQRIWVSLDWDKVPQGLDKKEPPLGHDHQLIPPSYKINTSIEISAGDESFEIAVSAYNPKFKALEQFNGFVEEQGFISINAENFSRSESGSNSYWQSLNGFGYSHSVMAAMPYSAKSQADISQIKSQSPLLEYDFYSFNFGQANVYLKAVPTHAAYQGKGVRLAIAIDDAKPVIVDFQTQGRSDEWKQNVLKNAAVKSAKQIINQAGKHTLKVWMVDSGVMLDQILIDLGGWKHSYAFPPETKMTH